jgi:signal transduction histidine kinase
VAHQLRSPLTAITLAAANIKRKTRDTTLNKYLSSIDRKVNESGRIIDHLVFSSRLQPPRMQRFGVFALIEKELETLRRQSTKRISIEQTLDSVKNTLIDADKGQVREVFRNIVHNAYDAVMDGDGKIGVKVTVDDEHVTITVSDNGPGTDTETLARAFDPFFTTKARGTGLGLSICRHIMRNHGGNIEIESELAKGTTVRLVLPKSGRKEPYTDSNETNANKDRQTIR